MGDSRRARKLAGLLQASVPDQTIVIVDTASDLHEQEIPLQYSRSFSSGWDRLCDRSDIESDFGRIRPLLGSNHLYFVEFTGKQMAPYGP